MENTSSLPINITNSALEEIKNLYQQIENKTEIGLRIGVEGGGCAGFSYIMNFEKQKEGDNKYILEGLIPIYIHPTQEIYLSGTIIDFKTGLDNRGFVYNNPNATEICGCGTSFSA
ncbi:MAG TPA: iron-sulfur cluster assembly accessory protein [Chitinophagales bacterium]|nr:iron-sulfur cluster assembly accessory protein [Chitinophagales bacterium]MCB9075475.1 iron-sulfur cluster assembly accessory protein [Chitinophagales bacterium]HMU97764.1 iron-sulfur cluster assembly accessory protein [Chitinophagales bacterium]HMV03240.1 iron-sulfur cluster assembly accessory protein [Chitinophagales bacterium]HMW93274.1 iron-sulfur cluster assembly accessory protein [Chitinophagales bacterium]